MRLYVTGGTGLVGSNVIKLARERYNAEIIASQFGAAPTWNVDYTLDPLDIADHEAIKVSIRKYKPDVVIHSAALIDQVFLYRNRVKSWAIMVDGTRAFAEACREIGARLIFVSSDWVFDGRELLVDESSPPLPVNFYGVMKVASERDLGAMDNLDYAVGRLAGVYGINYAIPALTKWAQGLGYGDLASYYAYQVLHRQPVQVWSGGNLNEQAHPSHASDCAENLLLLAQNDARGIVHCFGSESINRLNLARRVTQVFGGDPARIEVVPVDSAEEEAAVDIRIPYRCNASVERSAQILGRRAYTVDQSLQVFKQELNSLDLPQYGWM